MTDLSTTPRVCRPASPLSASLAATISDVIEERRIFHSFILISYSCTNFLSLSAENRKRWAWWQKLLKPFKCNDILTKDEITQRLWGFHFHAQHIFTVLTPSRFLDCELQFFEQAQDRQEKVSPVWSEVSGGHYVVPGFDRVEIACFNTLKNSQLNREIYGDRCCSQCSTMKMAVPWNLRYPPEPLEFEVLSRMPGIWWQLECGGNSQPWPLHSDLSFESQTWAWVYRVGSTGASN